MQGIDGQKETEYRTARGAGHLPRAARLILHLTLNVNRC